MEVTYSPFQWNAEMDKKILLRKQVIYLAIHSPFHERCLKNTLKKMSTLIVIE